MLRLKTESRLLHSTLHRLRKRIRQIFPLRVLYVLKPVRELRRKSMILQQRLQRRLVCKYDLKKYYGIVRGHKPWAILFCYIEKV